MSSITGTPYVCDECQIKKWQDIIEKNGKEWAVCLSCKKKLEKE